MAHPYFVSDFHFFNSAPCNSRLFRKILLAENTVVYTAS